MDLRAGPSAVERGAWPRSLRRAFVARSSSSRPNDYDCLRLLAAPSPRTRGAEKKESTGLRLNQRCPPYVTPSLISSFGQRLSGVRTAENKSLKNLGANRFCQSSARLGSAASGVVHRQRGRPASSTRGRGRSMKTSRPGVNPAPSGAQSQGGLPRLSHLCLAGRLRGDRAKFHQNNSRKRFEDPTGLPWQAQHALALRLGEQSRGRL
jgi:hypothetical protein